mmetsp:Transcript_12929/g.29268  ORF Transcript_12929/g.29268 Transcript_12929/m.29268 type:complete len:224 (-) Transcript_12929:70-741(-)
MGPHDVLLWQVCSHPREQLWVALMPVEEDLSTVGSSLLVRQHVEQCAFAASRWTHQSDYLARFHIASRRLQDYLLFRIIIVAAALLHDFCQTLRLTRWDSKPDILEHQVCEPCVQEWILLDITRLASNGPYVGLILIQPCSNGFINLVLRSRICHMGCRLNSLSELVVQPCVTIRIIHGRIRHLHQRCLLLIVKSIIVGSVRASHCWSTTCQASEVAAATRIQ